MGRSVNLSQSSQKFEMVDLIHLRWDWIIDSTITATWSVNPKFMGKNLCFFGQKLLCIKFSGNIQPAGKRYGSLEIAAASMSWLCIFINFRTLTNRPQQVCVAFMPVIEAGWVLPKKWHCWIGYIPKMATLLSNACRMILFFKNTFSTLIVKFRQKIGKFLNLRKFKNTKSMFWKKNASIFILLKDILAKTGRQKICR